MLPNLNQSRAGQLSLLCSVLVPQRTPAFSRIEIGFQVSGKQVRFRECHDLEFVVQGKPLGARQSTYHSALGKGMVVEAVTAPLTAEELSSLINASDVRYRLCKVEGSLKKTEIELLRKMYLKWKGEDGS